MTDRKPDNIPETCCVYRRKVVVSVVAVLSEMQCGVPDSALADLLRWDLEADSGKPVLAVRFCPWCGTPHGPNSEVRISDLNPVIPEPDDPADYWKDSEAPQEDFDA